jgi:hypothetical protein
MATYYVRKTGNDGNLGTSPAQAWLTIQKALGATGIGSGDTLYIGAGIYRENVVVAIGAVAHTFICGDVDGGYTGDAGEVVLTCYLTNDRTVPGGTGYALAIGSQSFLEFNNITFISDTISGSACTDLIFKKCVFLPSHQVDNPLLMLSFNANADTTIEQCVFVGGSRDTGALNGWRGTLTLLGNLSTAVDVNVQVKNNLFICYGNTSGAAIEVLAVAGGSGSGTGWDIIGNTIIGGYACIQTGQGVGGAPAGSERVFVRNNVMFNGGYAAMHSWEWAAINENYNIIVAHTDFIHSGIPEATGANDIVNESYATMIDIGQSFLNRGVPKPFGMPLPQSPWLGYGEDAGYPNTEDWLNRARPSGSGVAWSNLLVGVGAIEAHDFSTQETTIVDGGTGSSIKITGPGDQDILIPVDALTSTTISVKTYFDANHGTGTRPQASILACPAAGVGAQTVTAIGPINTWETLTFAAFTPTARGWVTLRLRSRPAAGNGIAYFDTITVV